MRISTDEMNDIISGWVDSEIPINTAGYEDPSARDNLREQRAKRFDQIVSMEDAEFRALYREKTGSDLSPMNSDGSYCEYAQSDVAV